MQWRKKRVICRLSSKSVLPLRPPGELTDQELGIQFSAKAIFDDKEMEANAIRYTEADISDLIERSFAPSPITDTPKSAGASAIFAEAKIWEVPRGEDGVRVADDVEPVGDLHDFWANILKAEEEKEGKKKKADDAAVGRGKRARAVVSPLLPSLTRDRG